MANPFQLPPCVLRAGLDQRRERFKTIFSVVLVAHLVLFIGMLMLGFLHRARTDTTSFTDAPDVAAFEPTTTAAAEQTPNPAQQLNSVVLPQLTNQETKQATTPGSQSPTAYVVKSGDTLSHIAKIYTTTVNAIKKTNGLDSDRLVVGAKLKIPEA